MYKGVQCIMRKPLLCSSVDHSGVFEMKGEFQVKGKKETHTSTSFSCSIPFCPLSSIFKLVGFFFFPHYQLLFVDHVCFFTVCFLSGCS